MFFLSRVLQKLGNFGFNPFRQQFNNTFIDTILDDVPDFIYSCQLQIKNIKPSGICGAEALCSDAGSR